MHDSTGAPMGATFEVEVHEGQQTVVLHSAGGAARPGSLPRNAEYAPALCLLLERLAELSASITDAYVDSTVVADMALDERRLNLPGYGYPVILSKVANFDELRRAMTRAEGPVGRSAMAKSVGGNERKRIRLSLVVPGFAVDTTVAQHLEMVLAWPQLPPAVKSGGQGFITDVDTRLAVEAHAMKAASAHYSSQGWEVNDVSAHQSYDLRCTRDGISRRVEVKGTTQHAGHILLTPNEVAHALAHPTEMALFVLAGIQVISTEASHNAVGGVALTLDPWMLETQRLSATGYSYALNG